MGSSCDIKRFVIVTIFGGFKRSNVVRELAIFIIFGAIKRGSIIREFVIIIIFGALTKEFKFDAHIASKLVNIVKKAFRSVITTRQYCLEGHPYVFCACQHRGDPHVPLGDHHEGLLVPGGRHH